MEFDWQSALLFFTTGINLFLALMVIIKNPKRGINQSFAVVLFGISMWALTNAVFRIATDYNVLYLWAILSYLCAVFIIGGLVYFTHVFPTGKASSLIKKVVFSSSIAIAIAICAPGFVLKGIRFEGDTKPLVTGPGSYLLMLYAVLFLGWAVINLIRKYRSEVGIYKEQLRYILLGIGVSTLFGALLNVVVPIALNDYSYVALGPNVTIFLVVAMVYTIMAHRLMDIRLVVARSVAYTLLIAIVASFYTLTIFLLSHFFLQEAVKSNQLYLYVFLTLFVAFTFQPLKEYIEKVTEKIFFKNKYDSSVLLSKLTKIMAGVLRLDNLTKSTLEELLATMHISKGAFLIVFDNGSFAPVTVNFDSVSSIDPEHLQWLSKTKQMLIFDEENDEVKQKMRELSLAISVPLYVEDNFHGVLLLGDKKSGEVYSDQDIDLLNIFGHEVAVAIQNSKSYEEIKNFNITLKKEVDKATKDLRNANEQLKQLDKLKDDFVSIASHELRTPMTAIKSYLWMAMNRADIDLSDKMKRYLDRAYVSTDRLINLVNDMLNVSRIEAGRIEITPQPFDMQTLVDDVVIEIMPKVVEKHIHLDIRKGEYPQVFADQDKVHEVVLNLLGNALKFTPNDGTITISFFCDGKVLETAVKDSGVGISKDDLSHLFQKFGRLDSSYVAAATAGGTGLGLFISRSLVELMKGRIWADSNGPGTGATFSFSLPIATPDVIANPEQYAVKVVGEAKALEHTAVNI